MTPPATPPPLPARPPAADPFASFDPDELIERSRAVSAGGRLLPLLLVPAGAAMMIVGGGAGPAGAIGLMLTLVGVAISGASGRRLEWLASDESRRVAALEELVMLRRWPEALDLATRTLDGPMLGPERRLNALRSLAAILARYHRFEDARKVHDALLAEPIDPAGRHAVAVARAMSLLREDLLVDADRAMANIRRDVAQVRDAVRRSRDPDAPAGAPRDEVRSAGLALLDLYRDVKTGHFDEAIALFEKSHAWLGESLGPRVADAWLLAAAAYDARGRSDEAQTSYANATTLAPAIELHRRYPETARLSGRYTATEIPV